MRGVADDSAMRRIDDSGLIEPVADCVDESKKGNSDGAFCQL